MIYWDRAEPFIKLLGDHEYETFTERFKDIMEAQKDRLQSFDLENMPTHSGTKSRRDQLKGIVAQKLIEKKKAKVLKL